MKTSTRPVTDEAAASHFLSGRRFALIGASDDPKNFSRTVGRELSANGYEIVPVNSTSDVVWQQQSYRTMSDVPGSLDGAIVMVPPTAVVDVVRQCIAAGLRDIWLFKGIGGPGSVSAEATALCQAAGVNVVDGACPLMFVDHPGWIHRLHRIIRVARGDLVDATAL